MNNMKDKFYYITIIGHFFYSCNSQIPADQNPMLLPTVSTFVKELTFGYITNGGYGYKFYDVDGTQKDCLQLLKDRGI
jgi:arabinogalactan endo-1,4-beta-galactosidase